MRLTGERHGSLATAPRPPGGAGTVLLVVTGLALVFVLDRRVPETPVQHLYYVPIIVAGVRLRPWAGIAAASVAVVLYHLAHPHVWKWPYEEFDLLQVGVFISTGIVSTVLAADARHQRGLAMTDDLTGLHNLRSFEVHLEHVVRRAQAAGRPLSLLVLDLDHLKALNDAHGHLAGAEAVRMVGRVLATALPATAIACRYGGDEFVVALPDCAQGDAQQVAEQVRLEVCARAPTLAGLAFPAGTVSVCIGIATMREVGRAAPSELGEVLFRAADDALYVAKRSGRNRVSGG